jgi:chromosome segregation ATPase
MLRRPFIATALAIIALIIVLLLVSLAQEHKHLRSVQQELGRTNQQVVKLEKVIGSLKADLDTAQSQLKEQEVHEQELTTELEKTKKETYAQLAAAKEANQRQFETITGEATKKLSESEKRIADLTEQLKSVSAQVEQLTSERDAARSKLSDTQSELEKAKETTQQTNAKLEATEAELEKVKEAAEQANAKATEFKSAGANTAKDAEAERSKLQAALDQANAEIERLKSELEKQKSTPPEQGESVSPAPGERRL